MDEDTFYAEVVEWLKERGHAQPEIERILERIRRYERETQTDSLMESYGKGGMTLAAIIAEALSEAKPLDLRVCGSAALSSALIYRLKVETLFLFEKLRAERRPVAIGEPPTILILPFRYEIPSTSVTPIHSHCFHGTLTKFL